MESKRVVTWTKEEGIGTIVVDNPPVNVLTEQVLDEIELVASEIATDGEVIAVIVTGAGEKAFVAGADIKSFPKWIKGGADLAEQKSLRLQRALNKIEQLPMPTIAAVNGMALGGGCELALSCDMRVAEEQAIIGLPEIKLGLFPGAGGTQRLPRLIGIAKAKEMMFTGEPVTASEAFSLGLVNHIVPRGKSVEKARELASKIATYSLPALSLMKASINEGFEKQIDEGLRIEAENFGKAFRTNDVKEGVYAFIEKRSPKFTHK